MPGAALRLLSVVWLRRSSPSKALVRPWLGMRLWRSTLLEKETAHLMRPSATCWTAGGMGGIPVLKSSPLQSNWTAKLKQMSEGLLLGSVLEGVFNMAQVARYANAFKEGNASRTAGIASCI